MDRSRHRFRTNRVREALEPLTCVGEVLQEAPISLDQHFFFKSLVRIQTNWLLTKVKEADSMDTKQQEATLLKWIQEFQGILFKVVRSHEADPENQDDLFQEIVIQLWLSLPRFQNSCSESTWIYRVALNTAFGWRRSETRRHNRGEHITAFVKAEAENANQLDDLHKKEKLEKLYAALRMLKEDEKAIMILYLDSLSYREIADILGISESNAGVKISRSKKKIEKLLKGDK